MNMLPVGPHEADDLDLKRQSPLSDGLTEGQINDVFFSAERFIDHDDFQGLYLLLLQFLDPSTFSFAARFRELEIRLIPLLSHFVASTAPPNLNQKGVLTIPQLTFSILGQRLGKQDLVMDFFQSITSQQLSDDLFLEVAYFYYLHQDFNSAAQYLLNVPDSLLFDAHVQWQFDSFLMSANKELAFKYLFCRAAYSYESSKDKDLVHFIFNQDAFSLLDTTMEEIQEPYWEPHFFERLMLHVPPEIPPARVRSLRRWYRAAITNTILQKDLTVITSTLSTAPQEFSNDPYTKLAQAISDAFLSSDRSQESLLSSLLEIQKYCGSLRKENHDRLFLLSQLSSFYEVYFDDMSMAYHVMSLFLRDMYSDSLDDMLRHLSYFVRIPGIPDPRRDIQIRILLDEIFDRVGVSRDYEIAESLSESEQQIVWEYEKMVLQSVIATLLAHDLIHFAVPYQQRLKTLESFTLSSNPKPIIWREEDNLYDPLAQDRKAIESLEDQLRSSPLYLSARIELSELLISPDFHRARYHGLYALLTYRHTPPQLDVLTHEERDQYSEYTSKLMELISLLFPGESIVLQGDDPHHRDVSHLLEQYGVTFPSESEGENQ